jgi:5-methylcytosine-specific restriction endonuclease McrA
MPYLDPKGYLEWQRKNRDKVRVYQNTWRDENRERVREYQQRYLEANREKVYAGTARSNLRRHHQMAEAEAIDRNEIFNRDGGKCHICGKRVAPESFHLDHLIPLSRGGSHTRANIALAHPVCNRRRGPGHLPAQLRLVG